MHYKIKRGFTLVELLVVIAIIGILASFLMPALRSAIESGRTISCINNLKQVGLSSQFYAEGWENTYFASFWEHSSASANGHSTGSNFWLDNIKPNGLWEEYFPGLGIFTCPSRTVSGTAIHPRTYAPMTSVHTYRAGAATIPHIKGSMIKRPTEIITFGDAGQNNNWEKGDSCVALTQMSSGTLSGDPNNANNYIPIVVYDPSHDTMGGWPNSPVRFRHGVSQINANFSFVDLHVKSYVNGSIQERNVKTGY